MVERRKLTVKRIAGHLLFSRLPTLTGDTRFHGGEPMNAPEERSMRSRIAAHRVHAAGKTNTAPARKVNRTGFHADSFVCDVTSSGVPV